MHCPKCTALFEALGGDSYEQYVSAMSPIAPRCECAPDLEAALIIGPLARDAGKVSGGRRPTIR